MANIISITNLVFSAPGQSMIDCMLQLDVFPAPIPFTASSNDVEEHGRIIHAKILAGEYGEIAPYVPPVIEQPEEPTVDLIGGAPSVI
jgi:hypothetical protein